MTIVFRLFLPGALFLASLAWSFGARSETISAFRCELKALSPAQRTAHEALTNRLFTAVLERQELADGFGFRIDSHAMSLVDLATWSQAEHLCCPFLRLTLDQEAKGGPLWLRLTGPSGTKAFLLAEMSTLAR